jgi:hypothetical protein
LDGASADESKLEAWQRGGRLWEARYKWSPDPPYGGSFENITTDWTSAVVDQDRKELLLVANGGHGSYAGNEGYAVRISADAPAWQRLTDPTPSAYHLFNYVSPTAPTTNPSGYPDPLKPLIGDYADRHGGPDSSPDPTGATNYGRMRSVHGWNRPQFAEGRVWWLGQDSFYSGSGDASGDIWSWDRNWVAEQAVPVPHASRDPRPFRYHGKLGFADANFALGGPACVHRSQRKIYAFANGNSPIVAVWDLAASKISNVTAKDTGGLPVSFMAGGQWAAIAENLGIVVVSQKYKATGDDATDGRSIWVWDAKNGSMSNGWVKVTPQNSYLHYPGQNAVYHAPSRAFIIGPGGFQGGVAKFDDKLVVLRIPTKSDGSYDATGTWAYTEMSASNANDPARTIPSCPPDYSGTYGKFNIIEDMGNGQSALVLVTSIYGPVYVYKLPASGV